MKPAAAPIYRTGGIGLFRRLGDAAADCGADQLRRSGDCQCRLPSGLVVQAATSAATSRADYLFACLQLHSCSIRNVCCEFHY